MGSVFARPTSPQSYHGADHQAWERLGCSGVARQIGAKVSIVIYHSPLPTDSLKLTQYLGGMRNAFLPLSHKYRPGIEPIGAREEKNFSSVTPKLLLFRYTKANKEKGQQLFPWVLKFFGK